MNYDKHQRAFTMVEVLASSTLLVIFVAALAPIWREVTIGAAHVEASIKGLSIIESLEMNTFNVNAVTEKVFDEYGIFVRIVPLVGQGVDLRAWVRVDVYDSRTLTKLQSMYRLINVTKVGL